LVLEKVKRKEECLKMKQSCSWKK